MSVKLYVPQSDSLFYVSFSDCFCEYVSPREDFCCFYFLSFLKHFLLRQKEFISCGLAQLSSVGKSREEI